MSHKDFFAFELSLFRNSYQDVPVMSPYSTGVCLSYLANLVQTEETRNNIIKLLHSSPKKYPLYFETVLNMINLFEDKYRATIMTANILFTKERQSSSFIALSPANRQTMLNFDRANQIVPEVVGLDNILDSASTIINRTIRKKTNGRIKNLMNPLMNGSHHVVAMSSILCYENELMTPFDHQSFHQFHGFKNSKHCNLRSYTIDFSSKDNNSQSSSTYSSSSSMIKPIKGEANKLLMLTMFHQDIKVSAGYKMKMIQLDFKNDDTSFFAILPNKKGLKSFEKMVKSLNYKRFHHLLQKQKTKRIDLLIPQINMETDSLNCYDQIQKMGFPDRSMTLESGEQLLHFRQKCIFSLNKKGTKVGNIDTNTEKKINLKNPKLEFNRPFIFFVIKKDPEVILLSGSFTG